MENALTPIPNKFRFKQDYVKLIAAGFVESQVLTKLNVDWIDFFEVCAEDPDFRKDIELAKKERASRWVEKIGESVNHKYTIDIRDEEGNIIRSEERPPNRDELGRDKLNFERLKFLAQADDPDKYGGTAGTSSKVNVALSFNDLKLLTPEQSLEVLQNDPFRVKKDIVVDYDKIQGLDTKE